MVFQQIIVDFDKSSCCQSFVLSRNIRKTKSD